MKLSLSPAVFGMTDGLTCSLGVILSLTHHASLILPTAVAVSSAECVGMAAGQWLSESDDGLGESLVIGLASGVAGLAPALPYAFLAGFWAIFTSVVILVGIAAAVTVVRIRDRGLIRALVETYGVLFVVSTVVWISQLVTPHGG